MEEILLPVVGGDKAKTTLGNELLDGACRHDDLLFLEPLRTRTFG
jgi:hypothetical protein